MHNKTHCSKMRLPDSFLGGFGLIRVGRDEACAQLVHDAIQQTVHELQTTVHKQQQHNTNRVERNEELAAGSTVQVQNNVCVLQQNGR